MTDLRIGSVTIMDPGKLDANAPLARITINGVYFCSMSGHSDVVMLYHLHRRYSQDGRC